MALKSTIIWQTFMRIIPFSFRITIQDEGVGCHETEPDPFEAELAGLSAEERKRRIEQRRRYELFAQRMMFSEAEDQANRDRYHK
jgi:hypothetical protein